MLDARSTSGRLSCLLVGTCLAAGLLLCGGALAQAPIVAGTAASVDEEPWPAATVAALRSFFERAHIDEVMLGLRMPDTGRPASATVGDRVAELGGSPEALFRFVQQQIRYQPYSGSVLGAQGVLRARRGNALDQASLLMALLRAAGRDARLVRGRLRWQDAVILAGPQPSELTAGDPWLRRVELVADHWWVEADGPEGRLQLDPSFPGTAVGVVPGARREIHDEPPRRLVAMARLTVVPRDGGAELARYEMPAGNLVGAGAEVHVERGAAFAEGSDRGLPDSTGGLHEQPSEGPTRDRGADPDDPGDQRDGAQDDLDRYLRGLESPRDRLRIRVGDQERRVSLDGLDPETVLDLRVRVELPLERPLELAIPFLPARGATVALVVESGATDIGGGVLPVYRLLQELSEQELQALVAYRERPSGEEVAPEVDAGAPVELHPARALQLAGLRARERFDRVFPRALGSALLAAGEQLRAAVVLERAPLRVVAVRWRPPAATEAGEATVWIHDEVVAAARPGLRGGTEAAFGFLHSALLGQVLHRVADDAPLTAFDLTLRSVGTGQRLAWMVDDESLPAAWPAAAVTVAREDRRLGRVLVGPHTPSEGAGGWWAVDPISGDADSRVVREDEVASAAVAFGAPLQPRELGSVLASLPGLHQAGRWLVRAADPGSGVMAQLLPGACAATTLVSDLLAAGSPPEFVSPDFATFCVRVSAGPFP